jgi:hypothetical protein
MFGRSKRRPGHEEEIAVDVTLEEDVSAVVRSVDAFLKSPNESLRRDLLASLEELDAQIAQGDDYHSRLVFPYASPESTVVGATSSGSIGEDMPSDEFQAQVALVKAAKSAVTGLTPDTLAGLRAAREALAAVSSRPK